MNRNLLACGLVGVRGLIKSTVLIALKVTGRGCSPGDIVDYEMRSVSNWLIFNNGNGFLWEQLAIIKLLPTPLTCNYAVTDMARIPTVTTQLLKGFSSTFMTFMRSLVRS